MNLAPLITIRRLRVELAQAHTLTSQLVALVDHYALAYRETQEQLCSASASSQSCGAATDRC